MLGFRGGMFVRWELGEIDGGGGEDAFCSWSAFTCHSVTREREAGGNCDGKEPAPDRAA